MTVWNPMKKPICSNFRTRCSLEKVCRVFSFIDMMKSLWWSVSAMVLLYLVHGQSSTEANSMFTPKRNVSEVAIDILHQYMWNLSAIKDGQVGYPSESTVISMLLLFILFQVLFFALGRLLFSSVENGSISKLTRWFVITILVYFVEVPLLFFLVYLLGMPTVGCFVYLVCNFAYETSVLIIVREYRDQLMGQDPLDLLRCNYYYLHGIL